MKNQSQGTTRDSVLPLQASQTGSGRSEEIETAILTTLRTTSFFAGLCSQALSLAALLWIVRENEVYHSSSMLMTLFDIVFTTTCWLALLAWPLVWLTPFLMTMSDIGPSWVERRFAMRLSRRGSFMAGVHIFFGLSTGSLLSMIVIDFIFDYAVPISHLLIVLILCLALCWVCVRCFDMEEDAEIGQSVHLERKLVEMHENAAVAQSRTQQYVNKTSTTKPRPTGLLEPLLD